jgi:hypothetical protein
MQERIAVLPPGAVSRLKKKAKRLQRKTGRPHHELLEEVAVQAGWANWHQITLAEKYTQELDQQFRTGLFFLMDIKEGQDLIGETYPEAFEILLLRDQELIDWLRNANVDNREESDEELRESIRDNYVCLRYAGNRPLPAPAEVIEFLVNDTFFAPDLIWLHGERIDPFADPDGADDDEEERGPDEPMPVIPVAELRKAFGEARGARLVLESPDTMERFKAVVESRKSWYWCLHCERAYPLGCYRQQGRLQMCPYQGCEGDTVMDPWSWKRIREINPGYPEIPALGQRYPMYP